MLIASSSFYLLFCLLYCKKFLLVVLLAYCTNYHAECSFEFYVQGRTKQKVFVPSNFTRRPIFHRTRSSYLRIRARISFYAKYQQSAQTDRRPVDFRMDGKSRFSRFYAQSANSGGGWFETTYRLLRRQVFRLFFEFTLRNLIWFFFIILKHDC